MFRDAWRSRRGGGPDRGRECSDATGNVRLAEDGTIQGLKNVLGWVT